MFFFSLFVSAQDAQETINKLKLELKNNPTEKRLATIYSDLTWYYSNISIDSALIFGKKAIEKSIMLNDSILLAQSYSDIALAYFNKTDLQNAKKNYLKAYNIRKIRKDEIGMAKIDLNLGGIFFRKEQYKEALNSYLNAANYFESIGKPELAFTAKANVGNVFFKTKNYPKALLYIKESTQYYESIGAVSNLCNNYLSLANVYLQLTDTVNAYKYYYKTIENCKKCRNDFVVSKAYNNISNIKKKQNDTSEVEELLKKAKLTRSKSNSEFELQKFRINDASILLQKGKFKEAKPILLELKQYFKNRNKKEELSETYNLLISTCANLNQPDSVVFYNESNFLLNEQISKTNNSNQTIELETKYQTEKKEKLLLVREAEAKSRNTTILMLSLLAGFIGLFAFLIYKTQKNKATKKQHEFDLNQALLKIENQHKLHEQRLEISRDLHDNIGAQLTFITSSVENIKHGFDLKDEILTSKLSNISDFTKDTIVELRDTIWAMNNEAISFEELKIRIINFIDKAKNSSKIDFIFEIDPKLNNYKLSSLEGMNIFRTIQEAVNNALKYSKANKIDISANNIDQKAVITINDNGIGFDQNTIEIGNGLVNMKKRIQEIGGEFSLESASENGTVVVVKLELSNKNHK